MLNLNIHYVILDYETAFSLLNTPSRGSWVDVDPRLRALAHTRRDVPDAAEQGEVPGCAARFAV